MRYISTRGGIAPVAFMEAVLMGLSTDGGLLLPESMPRADNGMVADWRDRVAANRLSYQELAFDILSLFISDIPAQDLKSLIDRSYSTFAHSEITPVIHKDGVYILELFHGPTLAFKDVALQFLGNVFAYILGKSGGCMNILGATSGDTGSAAIYGVRGKERINIFILHPHKRVSPVQELQMTTVLDANVFNLALRGTFDDGQAIVKKIFNDIPFKTKHHLGAINSINWARILAQVVYYVYAWLKVTNRGPGLQVDFSVPTGNFGDIFAGYIAKRLLAGQRIRRLILATNENDLLTRFVLHGDYSMSTVVPTTSPSMDIQVASNFERYLYYLNGEDPEKTRRQIEDFIKTGRLAFTETLLKEVRDDFASKSVSQRQTNDTIKSLHAATGYVLDPHTAVGVNAAFALQDDAVPVICLATAHPAKFGDAVEAAIGKPPELPASIRDLATKKSRCEIIEADAKRVKDFIAAHAIQS